MGRHVLQKSPGFLVVHFTATDKHSMIWWPAKSAVGFYIKCADAIMIGEKSLGVYRRMIDIDE
ncbi:MAG: hypothetical protein HFH03_05140 [Dorea sp.]|jgi:hypothetical protein|nr:hypothetical protein [Dorea sp.]